MILAGLGMLDCLPLELLWIIFQSLDVESCFNFRQVNRGARHLISNLPKYQAVARHALQCLRAVLQTGIGRYLAIADLYHPLCLGTCSICKKSFGGFLFLPTVTRCCFPCITSSPRLRVVSLWALRTKSGISVRRLRQLLPVVRTLPGAYTILRRRRVKRTEVVAEVRAMDLLGAMGFPVKTSDIYFNAGAMGYAYVWRFMVSTVLPRLDPRTGHVEQGFSCKGCQIVLEKPRWLWPNDVFDRRDRVYSSEGYLDHFLVCPEAIRLWRESRGGTITIREPEFTRRGGYLASPDCCDRCNTLTGRIT
jgi:hypothetical protein